MHNANDLSPSPILFRQARPADLAAAWRVVGAARDRMLVLGRRQWDAAYPAPSDVEADIRGGRAYVCDGNGEVVAYGAIAIDGEPAYDALEGRWSRPGSYAVVHRLCVSPRASSVRQPAGLASRTGTSLSARGRGLGAGGRRCLDAHRYQLRQRGDAGPPRQRGLRPLRNGALRTGRAPGLRQAARRAPAPLTSRPGHHPLAPPSYNAAPLPVWKRGGSLFELSAFERPFT